MSTEDHLDEVRLLLEDMPASDNLPNAPLGSLNNFIEAGSVMVKQAKDVEKLEHPAWCITLMSRSGHVLKMLTQRDQLRLKLLALAAFCIHWIQHIDAQIEATPVPDILADRAEGDAS